MIDPNATTIIIGLLTLLGTTVGAIIWVVRWAIGAYGKDIQAHTAAANRLAKASNKMSIAVEKNTSSNDEVLKFMKNLNGKLAKATIQTVKEQNVEHQTIKTQDKKVD